ncbi:hypothetical protein N9249_01100 [bacterium]|nr:hypothetical protein [bacterium]
MAVDLPRKSGYSSTVISLGGGASFGDEIRAVFSETGLLSKSPDFEYRAEQQQMAGEVEVELHVGAVWAGKVTFDLTLEGFTAFLTVGCLDALKVSGAGVAKRASIAENLAAQFTERRIKEIKQATNHSSPASCFGFLGRIMRI